MLNEHALRERERSAQIINDDGTAMINTFFISPVKGPAPQFLAASDRDFI